MRIIGHKFQCQWNIWLEHSCAHLFPYCLWLNGVVLTDSIWPFTGKTCHLLVSCNRTTHQEWVRAGGKYPGCEYTAQASQTPLLPVGKSWEGLIQGSAEAHLLSHGSSPGATDIIGLPPNSKVKGLMPIMMVFQDRVYGRYISSGNNSSGAGLGGGDSPHQQATLRTPVWCSTI